MIGREHILVVVGLFESFFYSGLVLGWASLNLLLKKEGVFSHLCDTLDTFNNDTTVNATEANNQVFYINNLYPSYYERSEAHVNKSVTEVFLSCPAQAKMLNLAYNIAVSVGAFTGVLWGILLDRYGIRALRLLISFCLSGGSVLLMFTTKEYPYMLFASMTMCSLVGIAVRLSCLQIAELFPRQRSTLITLYSGANTASAAVFTILKFFYDQGATWRVTVGIFLGLSLVALPATILLFPARNFVKLNAAMSAANKPNATQSLEQLEEKPPAKPEVKEAKDDQKPLPLTFSVFSISSLLYNFWFAWLMLYGLYYNGSMHLWVARASNDPKDLDTYVDILGISQLGALLLGPLAGILIDLNLSRVPKPNVDSPKNPTSSGDHGDYDQTVSQIRATFWMALLTTCMLAIVQICKFFDTKTAIIVSIVFYIIFRSAVMGVSITYMRQRFPIEHFNKLVGITASFRSICFLIQFPMFVWDTDEPRGVTIFNMVCLAFAFILPLHMKTKLLPWLMKREDKVANKIQNWETREGRAATLITTSL